jgi:hypothetical protein
MVGSSKWWLKHRLKMWGRISSFNGSWKSGVYKCLSSNKTVLSNTVLIALAIRAMSSEYDDLFMMN